MWKEIVNFFLHISIILRVCDNVYAWFYYRIRYKILNKNLLIDQIQFKSRKFNDVIILSLLYSSACLWQV